MPIENKMKYVMKGTDYKDVLKRLAEKIGRDYGIRKYNDEAKEELKSQFKKHFDPKKEMQKIVINIDMLLKAQILGEI